MTGFGADVIIAGTIGLAVCSRPASVGCSVGGGDRRPGVAIGAAVGGAEGCFVGNTVGNAVQGTVVGASPVGV